jgi:hypothetical protein
MVDITTAHPQADCSTKHSTRSVYGWMLRQYNEYFYYVTRQFWRIPEPPAINHEMDGSVVVVTGASSSLGLETAKQILIRATPRMLIDSHTTSYSPELGVQMERRPRHLFRGLSKPPVKSCT